MKKREIRAIYDNHTITVYQAYGAEIAKPAIKNQTFISPFKMNRMTWIKPSFLWMMYRSGWSHKEGQEHVLSIKITREGWEWALNHSCLSHFRKNLYASEEKWGNELRKQPVRIQWDPEKDIYLNNLEYKSIQVGLSGAAVEKYVNEWIVNISDISQDCKKIHSLLSSNKIEQAESLLPHEKIYPISGTIRNIINAS